MRVTDRFTFFWGTSDPFSNWHPAPFVYKNIQFAQTEQFMMYAKAMLFGDKEVAEAILADPNPRTNKALGRSVRDFDDALWRQKAKGYVYVGNREKFTQNEHLLEALLATAGTTLVEASPYDRIWGIGLSEDDPRALDPAQWRGTNWLGEVLTKLRDDLLQRRDQHPAPQRLSR